MVVRKDMFKTYKLKDLNVINGVHIIKNLTVLSVQKQKPNALRLFPMYHNIRLNIMQIHCETHCLLLLCLKDT